MIIISVSSTVSLHFTMNYTTNTTNYELNFDEIKCIRCTPIKYRNFFSQRIQRNDIEKILFSIVLFDLEILENSLTFRS